MAAASRHSGRRNMFNFSAADPGTFSVAACLEPKLKKHEASMFSLMLPEGLTTEAVLKALLKPGEAEQLLKDWHDNAGVALSETASSRNDLIFFPKSNNKSRSTQNADFKAAGLSGFADDLQATLVCVALVRKARDAGIDLTK